jgi:phosphate acetyltransferase/phosphate butyryltransferase
VERNRETIYDAADENPRPLFVTDAAINIYPSVEEKADIIQNAIELTHVLDLELPKVAILSAVETVSPKIKSTLDAAILCKMADRGQITGGILDGPLAFDNAVSEEAAKIKGIASPVAGKADIFVVPDLEAGNMLAKQLEYLAGAHIAGIVLGARVPIVPNQPSRQHAGEAGLLRDRSIAGALENPEAEDNSPRVMKSRRKHAQKRVRQFRNIEICPDSIHWPTCLALGRTSRRRRR